MIDKNGLVAMDGIKPSLTAECGAQLSAELLASDDALFNPLHSGKKFLVIAKNSSTFVYWTS